MSKMLFALPEVNILKLDIKALIIIENLVVPKRTFIDLKWIKKNHPNVFLTLKTSKLLFALPEVKILKPDIRPLILIQILVFSKMTFFRPEIA